MASSKDERAHADKTLFELIEARAREEQVGEGNRRNRRLSVSAARDALFLRRLEEASKAVFSQKIVPSKYALKEHKDDCERILNVVLSDLHFHSLLDGREVPTQYGANEEARRLAAVAVQVAEYKCQYRKNTTLYVHILGDIIQNQLHDARDGAPLAEQCAAAIRLLSQAVSFFSAHFPKVVVRCTPGNHGRNKARHHDRATYQKWDAIETIIYYAVKSAVQALPNVTVDIPYTPFYIAEAFGMRGFYTHGDTVLDVGNPGNVINIASIEKQANRLNAAEAHNGRKEFGLFVVGHVHCGTMSHLPNGSIVISNPPLIPSDSFAVSKGILETRCGQQLFESVPGYIVGDARCVYVDRHTDKDKSLDRVIEPFKGF